MKDIAGVPQSPSNATKIPSATPVSYWVKSRQSNKLLPRHPLPSTCKSLKTQRVTLNSSWNSGITNNETSNLRRHPASLSLRGWWTLTSVSPSSILDLAKVLAQVAQAVAVSNSAEASFLRVLKMVTFCDQLWESPKRVAWRNNCERQLSVTARQTISKPSAAITR